MASLNGDTTAPPVIQRGYVNQIVFNKRNPIIARTLCLIFGLVVYGCMSIEAWTWNYGKVTEGQKKGKNCLYNESGSICTFGIFVSLLAVLGAIMFLGGEFLVEKSRLINYRKEYCFFDLVFSALWTFLFFVCFCILESQWSHFEEPDGILKDQPGAGSVRLAIWFSCFSIISWGACTYMVLQRHRVMQAEAQYEVDTSRRASSFPATINIPAQGSTIVTF